MEAKKAVLVYGGAGQLGATVVKQFKGKGWKTVSVDFRLNPDADLNCQLTPDASTKDNAHRVKGALQTAKYELNAVVCVAGGWQGGNVKDEDIFSGVDKMFSFNVQSSIASAHIAAHFLKEGGLLVLTGAQAALSPTPGMIAYGITKAATHHLIASLADPGAGLSKDCATVGILPICLDTPTNRQSMPDANFDNWTPLPVVAELLQKWADGDERPSNGSLITIETKDKKTTFTPVKK